MKRIKTAHSRLFAFTILGLFLSVAFNNCGQPGQLQLVAPSTLTNQTEASTAPASSGPVQNCTDVLNVTQENLKIIFMVDNSDSTNQTDSKKYYRDQILRNFVNQYRDKQNFKYSFAWFGAQAVVWDKVQKQFVSKTQNAFGDSADFEKALDSFDSLGTQYGTAYNAAFTSIKDIVNNSTTPGDGWKYVVVFMSDGMPTDLGKGTNITTQIKALATNLTTQAQSLSTQASVSSIYFGPSTSTPAITNLQILSQAGSGIFVDTNTVSNIMISDSISIPGQVCTAAN